MNKKPNDIRKSILIAGVEIWKSGGHGAVTHRAIGAVVSRSPSAILYHFGYSMEKLRDAVAVQAVETQCVPVILQLLASNHKAVAGLSDTQRNFYLAKL